MRALLCRLSTIIAERQSDSAVQSAGCGSTLLIAPVPLCASHQRPAADAAMHCRCARPGRSPCRLFCGLPWQRERFAVPACARSQRRHCQCVASGVVCRADYRGAIQQDLMHPRSRSRAALAMCVASRASGPCLQPDWQSQATPDKHRTTCGAPAASRCDSKPLLPSLHRGPGVQICKTAGAAELFFQTRAAVQTDLASRLASFKRLHTTLCPALQGETPRVSAAAAGGTLQPSRGCAVVTSAASVAQCWWQDDGTDSCAFVGSTGHLPTFVHGEFACASGCIGPGCIALKPATAAGLSVP